MTNAELAILSLVAEHPRHGYEIEQIIQQRGMREWTEIGFSSIYYLLAKLDGAGLIVSRLEEGARGPARKVYEATPAGRQALRGGTLELLAVPHRSSSLELGLANLPLLDPAIPSSCRNWISWLAPFLTHAPSLTIWSPAASNWRWGQASTIQPIPWAKCSSTFSLRLRSSRPTLSACAPVKAWRLPAPKESCAAKNPNCRTNNRTSCAGCTTPVTIPSAISRKSFRYRGQLSTEPSAAPNNAQRTAPFTGQSHIKGDTSTAMLPKVYFSRRGVLKVPFVGWDNES